MAHEHAKEMIEAQEGTAGRQIKMTFLGGVLLVNSALAYLFFPAQEGGGNFYGDMMGMLAALLLGLPLVISALKELRSGHGHMDELAALAVTAAFATGEYFESGAIAFFMILTTLVEHKTALGARRHIESLIGLTPTKAHLVDEAGEREVEAKDLKPGDVVVVRPGDNIPGDGEVLEGDSTVNQANITGESLPVDKSVGSDVFGGTINMTGVMKIKITKAGADTTLGQVKDLILQAEKTKIPGMRLMERYARWYTPVILMLAAISFIFTKNLNIAIGLLVVACPCAIILASPTAMVAALSAASRLGVWVKDVSDLEKARNLTGIVFDKTGTVTTGVLSVTKLAPVEGVEGVELLAAASSAEQHSKHPVARAVMDVARKAKLNIEKTDAFEEVPGQGVRVVQNGEELLVGRASFIAERGVDVSGVDAEGSEGLSLLYAARGGKVLGWLGLEDKTRADASGAMDQLRELGLKKLVMVTGDRWSVAKRVAADMRCTDVQAEVLPGQKLELVDALKAQGHTVAVIGDGVNDAPALAAGDISIAMAAAGSDVAIHSASIALMNNNLNRIPFLIRLSQKTFGVVRQNMIFSVMYILIMSGLIVMDTFGASTPIVAVICHFLSSFVVVFNSARLVREGESLASMDAHSGEEVAPPRAGSVSVASVAVS